MASQRITIIGTGCIGTSIGLALKQSPDRERLELVGHDKELGTARKAHKAGAFDRAELNLHRALDGARLVILAVPLAAMREALEDVSQLLEPGGGVVVTDTAHLKVPVIRWAEEFLPEGNYFVGGDPFLAPRAEPAAGESEEVRLPGESLQGVEAASADLFRRAVYAITARPEDHTSAARAVVNLALVLGAEPLFVDPHEHDAVRAIAEGVPDLVATALFQATAGAPGWAEVRKAAGRGFATATTAAAGDAASRRMLALLARDPLVRGLDATIARLQMLREMVADGDAEALEKALAGAGEARAYWLAEHQSRQWEIDRGVPDQEKLFQRTLQVLFGEGLTKKRRDREP